MIITGQHFMYIVYSGMSFAVVDFKENVFSFLLLLQSYILILFILIKKCVH